MGRYLGEIMGQSPADAGIQWSLFADRPAEAFHHPAVTHSRVKVFRFKGSRFHSWEQLALPWSAWRARVDLLHCPSTGLPWWQPVPTVVTLHDTLPWTDEDKSERGFYRDRLQVWAYKKCAAIITISKSSFDDIVKLWPELERKLVVIPHGISDCYFNVVARPLSGTLRSIGVRGPYLLYIGGALPRKRADWAIRVFERIGDANLRLVLCGLPAEAQQRILQQTEPCLRARLCFTPFVSEDDMPLLYSHALAVLYPTLYEGFGFPALEAQAVGTPVLFSALGSLAELQGPGSIILPPHDLACWVRTCKRLVSERQGSHRSNERSQAWARQFSWSESARRHFELYDRIATTTKTGRRSQMASEKETAGSSLPPRLSKKLSMEMR
jgi:glycosyltransferase involved in cell wall biosynthesis